MEGPLDLRLNPQKGINAAERIRNISGEELTGMLIENADEPYAEEIADAVVTRQKRGEKIVTTKRSSAGDRGGIIISSERGAKRSGEKILPENLSGASH